MYRQTSFAITYAHGIIYTRNMKFSSCEFHEESTKAQLDYMIDAKMNYILSSTITTMQ